MASKSSIPRIAAAAPSMGRAPISATLTAPASNSSSSPATTTRQAARKRPRRRADRMTSGEKRFFVDPYLDWVAAEGLPVCEDFCIDLNALETAPWPRLGGRGAFAHLKGRGDLVAVFVLELAAGRQKGPPAPPL